MSGTPTSAEVSMRTLLALSLLFFGINGCAMAPRVPGGSPQMVSSRVQDPPAEVPSYVIPRREGPVVIDGLADDEAWAAAEPIHFIFPWDDVSQANAQTTVARMLYDDDALYIIYDCVDPYLHSEVTERDGPVYNEDAVEIFVAPNADDISTYFGFEMNILGTLLDYVAYDGGVERTPSESIRFQWRSEGVDIATTYEGTLNDHSDIDEGWVLEIRIPFDNFRHYGARIPPQPGDMWRLNLNRTAGYKGQFSLWSDTHAPRPSFHHSALFGKAYFSHRPAD